MPRSRSAHPGLRLVWRVERLRGEIVRTEQIRDARPPSCVCSSSCRSWLNCEHEAETPALWWIAPKSIWLEHAHVCCNGCYSLLCSDTISIWTLLMWSVQLTRIEFWSRISVLRLRRWNTLASKIRVLGDLILPHQFHSLRLQDPSAGFRALAIIQ